MRFERADCLVFRQAGRQADRNTLIVSFWQSHLTLGNIYWLFQRKQHIDRYRRYDDDVQRAEQHSTDQRWHNTTTTNPSLLSEIVWAYFFYFFPSIYRFQFTNPGVDSLERQLFFLFFPAQAGTCRKRTHFRLRGIVFLTDPAGRPSLGQLACSLARFELQANACSISSLQVSFLSIDQIVNCASQV